MSKQMTEMLKGTLEGIVVAILAERPAYGYEITAWLRSRASPTLPKAPSTPCSSGSSSAASSTWRRSRPRRGRRARCTPSTRRDGTTSKSSGGPGARTYRKALRRREVIMAAKWIETLTGSLEQKKQYKQYKARIEALPEPYGTVAKALQRYFMYYGGHGR